VLKTQNQYFFKCDANHNDKHNDKDRIINDSKLRISIKLKLMKLHISAGSGVA
jgi:hypothetical protein